MGNGGTTGALGNNSTITGTNTGTFIFNRSDNVTYNTAIQGAVNIVKAGTNTVTLTGNAAYTGTASVSGGALVVNGSLGSANTIQLASGAILSGTGSVGHVDGIAGSIIRPGPFDRRRSHRQHHDR